MDSNRSISISMNEEVEVLYDGKKHNKRQSSLFGVKAFPMDQTYDLFAGLRNSDNDDDEFDDIYDEDDEFETNNIKKNYTDKHDPNCLIM